MYGNATSPFQYQCKYRSKYQNVHFILGSLEASYQAEGGPKPEPPAGMSFVKFATKVANLNKFGQTKPPTSPTTSDAKMEF